MNYEQHHRRRRRQYHRDGLPRGWRDAGHQCARDRVSPTGLSTNTGAQGQFSFNFFRWELYTLDATDPVTGDRGVAAASISAQDEVSAANIVLNGQGSRTSRCVMERAIWSAARKFI